MILEISSRIDSTIKKELSGSLKWNINKENCLCLFIMRQKYDIKKGVYTLMSIKDKNNFYKYDENIVIKNISQQYSKEFETIPSGWNVIVLIEFKNKIPVQIKNLPETDSWYNNYENRIRIEIK